MPRYLYVTDHKTEQADTWPEESDVLWVDLGPSDRGHVHEAVKRLYAVHPQVIENLLKGKSHRPDLIVEDDAVSFMLALIPTEGEEHRVPHLSFILGKKFLVTAHLEDESPVVDTAFTHLLNDQMMDEGVDFALYQLLIGHVVTLKARANQLDQQFESLHRQLLRHPYRDLAPGILSLRKKAMAARHVLDPEGGIFELLKEPHFPFVEKRNLPYFQETAFLMQEVVAQIQQIRDGLAEMVEAYTSLQSNEINKVMWFLTIVSTLALPATTIASIYGMNFTHMPELRWRYGYWYVLALMFFVSVLLLLWMKIKRRD